MPPINTLSYLPTVPCFQLLVPVVDTGAFSRLAPMDTAGYRPLVCDSLSSLRAINKVAREVLLPNGH
ncbi:MAG: hypothetical protein HC896_04575 [Bacteroidales bacterium]|nr:hypothetical protein [Bacteroidales bacterium]